MARPGPRSTASDLADWAFISLGSNLGDSPSILTQATEALEDWAQQTLLRSSIWRSAPVDCPAGSPSFFNAIVGLLPRREITPEGLLVELQAMERTFGRQRESAKHAPRRLDLDLLVFGREERSTQSLSLPHPRAHLRRFVLAPWNEIAPGLVLPIVGRSVSECLAELPAGQCVERVGR